MMAETMTAEALEAGASVWLACADLLASGMPADALIGIARTNAEELLRQARTAYRRYTYPGQEQVK